MADGGRVGVGVVVGSRIRSRYGRWDSLGPDDVWWVHSGNRGHGQHGGSGQVYRSAGGTRPTRVQMLISQSRRRSFCQCRAAAAVGTPAACVPEPGHGMPGRPRCFLHNVTTSEPSQLAWLSSPRLHHPRPCIPDPSPPTPAFHPPDPLHRTGSPCDTACCRPLTRLTSCSRLPSVACAAPCDPRP